MKAVHHTLDKLLTRGKGRVPHHAVRGRFKKKQPGGGARETAELSAAAFGTLPGGRLSSRTTVSGTPKMKTVLQMGPLYLANAAAAALPQDTHLTPKRPHIRPQQTVNKPRMSLPRGSSGGGGPFALLWPNLWWLSGSRKHTADIRSTTVSGRSGKGNWQAEVYSPACSTPFDPQQRPQTYILHRNDVFAQEGLKPQGKRLAEMHSAVPPLIYHARTRNTSVHTLPHTPESPQDLAVLGVDIWRNVAQRNQ